MVLRGLNDIIIVCSADTPDEIRAVLLQVAAMVKKHKIQLSVTHRGRVCAVYMDERFEEPFRAVYLTEPRT